MLPGAAGVLFTVTCSEVELALVHGPAELVAVTDT